MRITGINNTYANNMFKGALHISQAIGDVFIPDDTIKYAYVDGDRTKHPGSVDIYVRTKNDEVYEIKHAMTTGQSYKAIHQNYTDKLTGVFSGRTESINGVTIGGKNEFSSKFHDLELKK